MTTARGIRNNNPGNIRWGADWQGLVPADKRTDDAFCQFSSAEYGIRAIVVILKTYYRAHKLDTVRKIVSRWAPPNENNTEAYVQSVASALGKAPNESFVVTEPENMRRLVTAIIKHENGEQPYVLTTIRTAMTLAGIA